MEDDVDPNDYLASSSHFRYGTVVKLAVFMTII